MPEEKNLKPYQYYADLYDKFTVERCRRFESTSEKIEPGPLKYQTYEIPGKEMKPFVKTIVEVALCFIEEERYSKKKETIREWMEKDEQLDIFFEEAKAPESVTCLTCGRLMFVSTKTLEVGHHKEPDRVMFFYNCPLGHVPLRVFYDNGQEYRPEPRLCSKCHSSVLEKHARDGQIITITSTCVQCGNVDTETTDLTPKKEVIDPDYAADRDRFCLSDEQGQKLMDGRIKLEHLSIFNDIQKEREGNKDLYDQAAKIKKLKIIELEKLLIPVLEKTNYLKLQFQTPQIGKDVFVPFIVYDGKNDRTEYDSIHNLKKLLKNVLENTNWRLMSEGLNYRLGMLEGRLRAYEKEEDLMKLIKDK